MIIEKKVDFFESQISGEVREFSIDLSDEVNFGVAFEIISSGIYKDKPLAIVRELCSNAQDSHARAGNAHLPFEVHVPTFIEPFWSVRDFGTGLSEENVYRLLAGIFNSDKRTTNGEIGGFGLGSKTPFSYTDAYDIVSYFEGVAYCFSAHLNEHGKPCVTKTTSYVTNEPNGVLISLPVKDEDIRHFMTSTRKGLAHFYPLPRMTGGDVALGCRTVFAGGDDWLIVGGLSEPVSIQMGPVVYPVDVDLLKLDMNNEDHQFLVQAVKAMKGVIIQAPVGSIKVTASREDVSYTAQTITYLREAIFNTIEDMRRWVVDYAGEVRSHSEVGMLASRLGLLQFSQELIERLNIVIGKFRLGRLFSLKTDIFAGVQCFSLERHYRRSNVTLHNISDTEEITLMMPPINEATGQFTQPLFYWIEKWTYIRHRISNAQKKAGYLIEASREEVKQIATELGADFEKDGLFFDLSEVSPPSRALRAKKDLYPFNRLCMNASTNASGNLCSADWIENYDDCDDAFAEGEAYFVVPMRGYQIETPWGTDSFIKLMKSIMARGVMNEMRIIGARPAGMKELKSAKKKGLIKADIVFLEGFVSDLKVYRRKAVHALFSRLREEKNNANYLWGPDDMDAIHYYWRSDNRAVAMRVFMQMNNHEYAAIQQSAMSYKKRPKSIDVERSGLLVLLTSRQRCVFGKAVRAYRAKLSAQPHAHSEAFSEIVASNPLLNALANDENQTELFARIAESFCTAVPGG